MNKHFNNVIGLIVITCLGFFNRAIAQDDAILLVISNQEVKVLLDGVEKGTTKANAAFRITTTIGEHYVEAERLGTVISQNKGEIVQLEAGKQKIIKLEFADLTPALDGNALPVAELNFALSPEGLTTVVNELSQLNQQVDEGVRFGAMHLLSATSCCIQRPRYAVRPARLKSMCVPSMVPTVRSTHRLKHFNSRN